MRVLITGGTGFLGSHVVRGLLARGDEVRALVRPGRPTKLVDLPGVEIALGDLLDEASLRKACRGMQAVIHCAVHAGFWRRQDAIQRRVIADGTSALLRAAHAANVSRIVHVSSIATIGVTRDGQVLDEEARWSGRTLGMGYVGAKREAEDRALAAARGGIPVVIICPGGMMGPKLDGSPPSWHLRRWADGSAGWAPPGGTSIGDVEDVAAGALSALDRGRVAERYIMAGHNLTWRELHLAVARHAGKTPRVRVIPMAVRHALWARAKALDLVGLSRPPYTPEFFSLWGWFAYMDSGKAQRELGYRIRPLEETLSRYRWEAVAAQRT